MPVVVATPVATAQRRQRCGSCVVESLRAEGLLHCTCVLAPQGAAVKIQKMYRGVAARGEVNDMTLAATKMQCVFRGHYARLRTAPVPVDGQLKGGLRNTEVGCTVHVGGIRGNISIKDEVTGWEKVIPMETQEALDHIFGRYPLLLLDE